MNNNLEDELCKSLFGFNFIKPLDLSKNKLNAIKFFSKNNISFENENIMIIHSDQSGVGKSTYIQNKSTNDYVYFPIDGIFSKDNTLKRLKKLNKKKEINNKKKLLMHFDLYDTDQIILMNDFLYFILITKLYGQDDNIFYLSRNIKIYIEVPNSFIDFFTKFPILDLFPKYKLSINNLEPLIVPEDICSNIKIVSLYLKLLKEENEVPEKSSPFFKADNKVDKNAIVFPFTPSDLILKEKNSGYDYNKIVINAQNENKKLTQEVCQNLIMNEIKINRPTYYQIITFIKVLSNQLIQFNRNYLLSACTIIDTGNFNNCSVRSLIIRKFIDISSYFAKGAFTKLKEEQKAIQDLMGNKNNDKEKIEQDNKILEDCKHKTISFEDIDLALIFFHGGNNIDFFSIITNKQPEDKTYKELLRIVNLQSGNDIIKRIKGKDKSKINLDSIEKLNDYRNYKQ